MRGDPFSPTSPPISPIQALPTACSALSSFSISAVTSTVYYHQAVHSSHHHTVAARGEVSQLSPVPADATEVLNGEGFQGGRSEWVGGGSYGGPTEAEGPKADTPHHPSTAPITIRRRPRAFIGAETLLKHHWSISGPIAGHYLSPFQPITACALDPSFGP